MGCYISSAKALICLLLLTFFQVFPNQVGAEGQDRVVIAELPKALETLSKRFDVVFSYDWDLIKDIKIEVDIRKKSTLEGVIKQITDKTDLVIEEVGRKIFVVYSRMPAGETDAHGDVGPEVKLLNKRPGTGLEVIAQSPIHINQPILKSISGIVTDIDGEPLIGVNVIEKGTANGTATDLDGAFSMDVIGEQSVLQFTYIGYESHEILVGSKDEIVVSMIDDSRTLDEVVVTAFGIEREKRALSYAVQEIDGSAVAAVGNSNVVNSLQGKIAGVTIKQSSGAPGSQSEITIRGSRSFVGNNEPLYVVDGMPISSGGRTIDINPNDVKSINVLKGPTAAALYGLRASNGVIVIETHKGENSDGGKPTVTFETNLNFDRISIFPDVQQTYAQGERGVFNAFSSFSWGPRIDTLGIYTNQLGEPEQAAVYDNPGTLFTTGSMINSNLSIANAFDRGSYAVNMGFADQSGILDNSGLKRINLKIAGAYDLLDNLKMSTSVNYSNNTINSLNLPWWATFAVPPSYDLKNKPTHEPGDPYQQINFRGQHDNLYWAMDHNYSNDNTARLFGNMNFNYQPVEWLSFNYRIGLDEYTRLVKSVTEKGSGGGRTDPPSGGQIRNSEQNYRQINSNLNATISKEISDGLQFDLLLGNEVYDVRSNSISNVGSDIVIGGFHHISNTAVQTTTESLSTSRVFGLFGSLSLSYDNMLYLNATGRNDLVSNMPSGNRSFFYPSLGVGVVFSKLLNISEDVLSFGKFRASAAEVGQAGPIFSTQTLFVPGSAVGGFTFPYQGLNAFTQSNDLNSSDLQPENTKTLELGFDLRFLKNRIGIDYTFYDSKAEGQIYRVPIASSTGYSSELRNAGEMSIRGHEIVLNLTPVQSDNFTWDLTTNFSTFTNKVISLAEGIEELGLGGFLVTLVAREGEEYPSLRGTGYARDPVSGEVVVDSRATLPNGSTNVRYGMPLRSPDQVVFGSVQPDFEMNFINEFRFKNLTLSAQLDWRKGGILSSGYNRLGKLYGILSETQNREDQDYIFSGKKGYFDENGDVFVEGNNDIQIEPGYDFYRVNQDPIRESNIYDASYVRLRELKISYAFSDALLSSTFLKGAEIYFIGRNLWLDAALPHFDPEMFNNTSGESYNSYPQTKSFGGGFRVRF